jgi:hypothetical protein
MRIIIIILIIIILIILTTILLARLDACVACCCHVVRKHSSGTGHVGVQPETNIKITCFKQEKWIAPNWLQHDGPRGPQCHIPIQFLNLYRNVIVRPSQCHREHPQWHCECSEWHWVVWFEVEVTRILHCRRLPHRIRSSQGQHASHDVGFRVSVDLKFQ